MESPEPTRPIRRMPVLPGGVWVRVALLAAVTGFYFGSLWLGARYFPHAYDWRRNVISNLLSPRDNPDGYWIPATGLALAGVCMLPLIAWIEMELGDGATKLVRRLRRPAVLLGVICLIGAALVVPQHRHAGLLVRHAHEALARTSATGLAVWMLCACGSKGLARRRGLRRIWWGTTLAPIAGAVGSIAMVLLGHLHGIWTAPADFLRGTMFWHLSFYEWVGSVAVFVFFASAVGILRDENSAPRSTI